MQPLTGEVFKTALEAACALLAGLQKRVVNQHVTLIFYVDETGCIEGQSEAD